MANANRFTWYELMTSDMAAAETFYRSVVGWETEDMPLPGMRYTLLKAGGPEVGGPPVGGLTTLPDDAREAGMPPMWIGYVGVDDADRAVARVTAAGGKLHHGPADVPGIGRFATVSDPGGAAFIVFASADAGSDAEAQPHVPGHVGWHELHAADGGDAALTFYADQFGWTRDGDMDMGPMGKYRFFATGGDMVGAAMDKPAEMPVGAWQYYFTVEAMDAAVLRVAEGGGRMVMDPMEVPGGSWAATAVDPQGAVFGLTAARR